MKQNGKPYKFENNTLYLMNDTIIYITFNLDISISIICMTQITEMGEISYIYSIIKTRALERLKLIISDISPDKFL